MALDDLVGRHPEKRARPGSHTRRIAPAGNLGAKAREGGRRRTGGLPRIGHALERVAQGYMTAWKYTRRAKC